MDISSQKRYHQISVNQAKYKAGDLLNLAPARRTPALTPPGGKSYIERPQTGYSLHATGTAMMGKPLRQATEKPQNGKKTKTGTLVANPRAKSVSGIQGSAIFLRTAAKRSCLTKATSRSVIVRILDATLLTPREEGGCGVECM